MHKYLFKILVNPTLKRMPTTPCTLTGTLQQTEQTIRFKWMNHWCSYWGCFLGTPSYSCCLGAFLSHLALELFRAPLPTSQTLWLYTLVNANNSSKHLYAVNYVPGTLHKLAHRLVNTLMKWVLLLILSQSGRWVPCGRDQTDLWFKVTCQW